MDLDGDGHLDVISGGFPGHVYLFRGSAEGTWGARANVLLADGTALKVQSASAPFAVDWDRDGDLDLVVGDIQGKVWLFDGQGGKATLSLGAGRALEVGGEAIQVGGGDAGPVVADWDGDGTLDLILGTGNGEVFLYRNGAAKGAPQLDAPVTLLKGSGWSDASESTGPGARVKPCVTDWNGDGLLDLVVGDISMTRASTKDMTPEQIAEAQALRTRRQEISARMEPIGKRILAEVMAELQIEGEVTDDPESLEGVMEGLGEERRQAFIEKATARFQEDPEAKAVQDDLEVVMGQLAALEGSSGPHGYVWVLLRQPAAPVTPDAAPTPAPAGR